MAKEKFVVTTNTTNLLILFFDVSSNTDIFDTNTGFFLQNVLYK